MKRKNTVSDTPLTGFHQIFPIFQSLKEVTCEKVAHANLEEMFELDLVQTRPESTRSDSNCLSISSVLQ